MSDQANDDIPGTSSGDDLDSPAVRQAKIILGGGGIEPKQTLDLVKKLKRENEFRWARRLLEKVRGGNITDAELRSWLAQQHALCTYKDQDLPVLKALADALAILKGAFDLASIENQETLGLAGAIFKRYWQATGQKDQLERSYEYYRRGYDIGPAKDQGYTAINAAFVLDQLAAIEEIDAAPSAATRRAEARAIREAVVAELAPMLETQPSLAPDWWYLVTVAEAFFGLQCYPKAQLWLERAKAVNDISEWEFRTTAFQLAALHQLQQPGTPASDDPGSAEAVKVLDAFLGSPAARESAFAGKIGLALSGGGFRASLFHIGLLARLADIDLLRRIEVLSCVSGGSIIGTHYYLQLREVLETTDLENLDDDKIREVYIGIVQRVASDFLAGVQTNIRMRVFANPLPLLRSVVDRGYTRTTRLGELFEEQLFARVWTGASDERKLKDPPILSELRTRPTGAPTNFLPKIHNWRRKAKVPVLILNATTLNTGHAWQYTTSFMGEAPWAINPVVDGTNRLRRMYYRQAPPPHQKVRLGQAVVASACVPGLFEPVRLDGLYQLEERGRRAEPLVVRQVDGGVHDNQGLASLLEQGCDVILVSDASGQTAMTVDPGGGAVAPLGRSNAVLMQRVRQEQYAHLDALQQGGLLKGAMFIHLKQGLDVEPLGWIGCEEPPENSPRDDQPYTPYGIRKEVQELLAGIRTDLDSFSDAEAFALMTSGYRMAEHYLPKVGVLPARVREAKGSPAQLDSWRFLAIERVLDKTSKTDPSYGRLIGLLGSGGNRMFRIWSQSRILLLSTTVLAIAGALLLLTSLFITGGLSQIAITVNGWAILTIVALLVALAFPKFREHAARITIGLAGLVLWMPAWFHLAVIDGIFLRLGRLGRFK